MPSKPTAVQPKNQVRRPASGLLKEQAYDRLKDSIVTGLYLPASFLSERRLVEELGMSKTPIRAALERLEGEGYVRVSPQQGIVVREPSLGEIADQFDIRLALERHVVESLAGQLASDQVAQLRENLRCQYEAAEGGDLAESIRLDREFHLMLCEFHGNHEILATMRRLREKMTWIIGLVFKRSDGRMVPNHREHEAIAEAIIAGDSQAAVAGLRTHWNTANARSSPYNRPTSFGVNEPSVTLTNETRPAMWAHSKRPRKAGKCSDNSVEDDPKLRSGIADSHSGIAHATRRTRIIGSGPDDMVDDHRPDGEGRGGLCIVVSSSTYDARPRDCRGFASATVSL